MAHVYSHGYDFDSPEQALAVLKRQRTLKLVAVMVGLVVALGVAIGASALMYSDEPDAATPAASD